MSLVTWALTQLDLMEFVKDIANRNYILVGMVSLILLVVSRDFHKGMMKRLGGPRWKRLLPCLQCHPGCLLS